MRKVANKLCTSTQITKLRCRIQRYEYGHFGQRENNRKSESTHEKHVISARAAASIRRT